MVAVGMLGIKRAPYSNRAVTCFECYRSWLDDITPGGRCPWEHLHSRDRFRDVSTRRRKAIVGGLWG